MQAILRTTYVFLYFLEGLYINARRLFCSHSSSVFIRNLYGDEIIEHGWNRSLHKCRACGALIASEDLQRGNFE